ncbi:MAG: Rne/Rng family ribonuclease, partial [Pseudomonadota bacterium]
MSKKILIDAIYPGNTRVVIYDQNRIQDYDYENSHKKQLKGNIYLAKVTRVEPSLQAAFIEYGGDKHGFLPFNEIHPNYFSHDEEVTQANTGAIIAEKIPAITLTEAVEVEEVVLEEPILEDNPDEEKELLTNMSSSDAEEMFNEREESNHNTIHNKYKIQDVIKKGQVILIQVTKEERGNKGASCTSYISLAGRYCVLMPNSDKQSGISRRISSTNDRRKLKEILSTIDFPDGVGIILRTAGAGKTANDIRRDYYYLARLWNAIREHVLSANVNSFIHAESDLIKRTIRDLYSSEVSEILIQGNESYKTAKDFIKKLLPLHVNKVKEYKAKTPIFTKFNIEEQLSTLYNPVAHLPSGGYIVINPTEALIAIDVNSGKATTEKNIEETATKTNIEAAFEVARQLRLRDMSGLIVIDFIDMLEVSNRKSVERALRNAFQTDRAKVQLSTISPFGLLELSRQRLQSSFMEN